MAGEAYTKRYTTGFADDNNAKPVDAQFLNLVETELLRLIGADPVDHGPMIWDAGLGRFVSRKLVAADIDSAAGILKTQLAALGIVNADVASAAAIARSKLDFGSGLVNSDIAAAAAIAISKLAGYPSDITKELRGDGSWQTVTDPGFKILYDSGALGSAAASIDSGAGGFSTSYNHLKVMVLLRTSVAAVSDGFWVTVNNDSGATSYSWSNWNGSSASTGDTAVKVTSGVPGASETANYFVAWSVEIPFYAQTNTFKSIEIEKIGQQPGDGSSEAGNYNGTWKNTSAITRVKIVPNTGPNFVIGSRMIIYGIP